MFDNADWICQKAEQFKDQDKYFTDSLFLIAQKFYPNNTNIKLKSYINNLESKNYGIALRELKYLINVKPTDKCFEDIEKIISELHRKLMAAQNDFLSKIPKSTKQQIHIFVAENSQFSKYVDIMVYVFEMYPEALSSHGLIVIEKVLETLNRHISMEHLNLLVLYLAPNILQHRLSYRKETLTKIYNFTIQFYITWNRLSLEISNDFRQSMEPKTINYRKCLDTKNMLEKYFNISEAEKMDKIYDIFRLIGTHMDWELTKQLKPTLSLIDQFSMVEKCYNINIQSQRYTGNTEVYYAFILVFVQALKSYKDHLIMDDLNAKVILRFSNIFLSNTYGMSEKRIHTLCLWDKYISTQHSNQELFEMINICGNIYQYVLEDANFKIVFQDICNPILALANKSIFHNFLQDSYIVKRDYTALRETISLNYETATLRDKLQALMLADTYDAFETQFHHIYKLLDINQIITKLTQNYKKYLSKNPYIMPNKAINELEDDLIILGPWDDLIIFGLIYSLLLYHLKTKLQTLLAQTTTKIDTTTSMESIIKFISTCIILTQSLELLCHAYDGNSNVMIINKYFDGLLQSFNARHLMHVLEDEILGIFFSESFVGNIILQQILPNLMCPGLIEQLAQTMLTVCTKNKIIFDMTPFSAHMKNIPIEKFDIFQKSLESINLHITEKVIK